MFKRTINQKKINEIVISPIKLTSFSKVDKSICRNGYCYILCGLYIKKPVLESICWYLPKPFKCVHFKLAISLLRLYPTVILAQDICTRVFIFIHIISEENWKPK